MDTPGNLLGKALHYLSSQWPKLVRFDENGAWSIDNNLCENPIRPFVVSRRNWLFCDAWPAPISTRSSKPAKPTASNLTRIWWNCSASCHRPKPSKTSRHCYPGNSSSQKLHILLRLCSKNQSRGLKAAYAESAVCQVFGGQIDILIAIPIPRLECSSVPN